MKNKVLDIIILILKIIIIVATVSYLIYTIIDLSLARLEDLKYLDIDMDYINKFPFAWLALFITGIMYYGIVLIFSIAGLIISCVYKTNPNRNKDIKSFILLIIVPIISEILIFSLSSFLPIIIN